MATGVKPRDEDHSFTRSDLEAIQDAMKNKKFRDLFNEYCEEVRDPANQALYQKEMTQLEKERGYDVTFINPKGCYVIKTSVAGDRKAFINICSNTNVGKPSYNIQEMNGQKGMNWQIPYSLIPPREDYDYKKKRCIIYDVVFHPDTLRMAEANIQFRDLVNKTAFDGLKKTYNIHLDNNNFRFPKSQYKGMTIPAVIRKEDPNFKPPEEEKTENLSPDILDKLYPQHIYSEDPKNNLKEPPNILQKGKLKNMSTEFTHVTENGYTVPKYVIKQQKNVDLQDYTYSKDSKQYLAIPSHIVVEISLPLLSTTKDCVLDVQEKSLSLISDKPAKYKLNIALPYSVNDKCGHAQFDKTKQILTVTLPVNRNDNLNNNLNSLKIDSGVDSEENSSSQSDEENNNRDLIVELSSTTINDAETTTTTEAHVNGDAFLAHSLNYMLPHYTHNVLDNVVAFTFHVKNTEPQSVEVKHENNNIWIKFTSIGSGFVPIHYAAIINFDEPITLKNASGEAWDNNVILQLELDGDIPQKFQIGLSEKTMTCEYFDMPQVKKTSKILDNTSKLSNEAVVSPVVEVTNSGTETNIVLSSKHKDYEEDEDDIESTVIEKEIVWIESNCTDNGAKSILRKPASVTRSFSESSVGDVASSMDYISSDCIPEESSLKKTVRFNNIIAKQFYRYNSSIEGQKKKNQRKKSKKRNLERRKSESEAEDESGNFTQTSKPRLKSVLKQRRDSGLADTSDAEAECKTEHGHDAKTDTEDDMPETVFKIYNNDSKTKQKLESAIWESSKDSKVSNKTQSINCANIKHNTDLYNPDRLNKGKYLEVTFKNDLIFDLDM